MSINFPNLIAFLKRIGFEEGSCKDHAVVLKHPPTDTVIALIVPHDGVTVRPADLLSVLTRLEFNGIVDTETLAQFRAGQLPLAS